MNNNITTTAGRVLITGISSGIGLGLAKEYLTRGWTVYGISRNAPDLGKKVDFHFAHCDLSREKEIAPSLRRLFPERQPLDLVVLNAGILGPFGDLQEQELADMQRVMQVNLWANKSILDVLFSLADPISQIVLMSSGASQRALRGWGGYAISKAALNMFTELAATERPETHFCALAPGLVDTAMQDQLCSLPPDARYPGLQKLRLARGTSTMPDSTEIAPRLANIINELPKLVPSGKYADIRTPPLDQIL
ncbi:SDR family NAD(P)-dependent oxidoreductase [Planctomicrobium sp. SH668]|uniref:SDR family NAD(P)-dependent oxidoreductase n=1 Tax=Planctomicrobium sp. SH668 TaxID=3448126 RepID=UPI003F5BD9A6